MKSKFSTSWNSSIQPRKQRKFRANAPKHIRGKFVSAHLSPALRKKYGTRSLRLKSGDKVTVMVGNHKGKSGKIDRINVTKSKVYLTGIEVGRRDGSKINPPFKASNLMITELDLDDKNRVAKYGVKETKPAEKKEEPKAKTEAPKEKKTEEKK